MVIVSLIKSPLQAVRQPYNPLPLVADPELVAGTGEG